MAGLDAVNQVGESMVALLRSRRNLLAAAGQLGPVPAGLDISQLTVGQIAGGTVPSSGLTLTCYHVGLSDHTIQRAPGRAPVDDVTVALELAYLLTVWSTGASDEYGVLSWAMLELSRYAVLDRSLLQGGEAVWRRDETVQIVPEALDREELFRLWGALQQRYRLSLCFRARVLHINYGPGREWPNVVAARFGLADVDPLTPEDA